MRLQYAEIHWDESGLPYSPTFADIYHSRQGGLEESEQVFLNANQLQQRFADITTEAGLFTVAELGFGTGLNFLLTWQLWQKLAPDSASLHYLGFEQYPIEQHTLQRFYQSWPELQPLAAQLLEKLPGNCAGIHRLHLSDRVTLDLYLGDAATLLQGKHQYPVDIRHAEANDQRRHQVDAWFLDGFSPAKNPRLWSPELFQLLAANSGPDTTLSSYTVASSVIKGLQAAGFNTEKKAGFGNKRHRLQARYDPSTAAPINPQEKSNSPWFSVPLPNSKAKTAIVIGAGLAGSSSAYSLARRGWKVLVVDSANQVAGGASGNPQAVLHCRLQQQRSAGAEFMLQAYLYALGLYQSHGLVHRIGWHACGVLQMPDALNRRKPLNFDTIEQLYPETIVRQLSLAEASTFCGAQLKQPAWLFPQGGWLNPALLCAALLDHENIEVKLNSSVSSLAETDRGWAVSGDADAKTIGRASVVIIANSYDASRFSQSCDIPLLTSQGQISQLQSNANSEALSAVVSGPRSICPADDEAHMIGASYRVSGKLTPGLAEDNENRHAVQDLFAESSFLSESILGSRVSVRCNSPDQLPVVGLLPRYRENLQRYAELARNARRWVNQRGAYYPGLFINVAHGSYGLSSCPLSAEYLASLINAQHSPFTKAQMDGLNPIRFLIRDLKKQRLENAV